MQRQTHNVHFDDFSGSQFERLCFAYFLRQTKRRGGDAEWCGQLGGDEGRDLVCRAPDAPTLIVQCANVKRLPLRKVRLDLHKLASAKYASGADFLLVCGGPVSSKLRERIKAAARSAGFHDASVWSNVEFEEHLRADAPDLLRRFIHGEAFPDSTGEELRPSSEVASASIGIPSVFDVPSIVVTYYQTYDDDEAEPVLLEYLKFRNVGVAPATNIRLSPLGVLGREMDLMTRPIDALAPQDPATTVMVYGLSEEIRKIRRFVPSPPIGQRARPINLRLTLHYRDRNQQGGMAAEYVLTDQPPHGISIVRADPNAEPIEYTDLEQFRRPKKT